LVNIIIDGQKILVDASWSVLEAAQSINIKIPSLCYLKNINKIGACRMCLVEIKNMRNLQAACVYPVSEGLEIFTNTQRVREARKVNLELILSNHEQKCFTCVRNMNCELQRLANELDIKDIRFNGENIKYNIDDLSESIVRDNNKCILCRRCVAMCKNIQTTSVIDAKNRGFKTEIGCCFNKSLEEISCIMCGQCITVCPVGALSEKSHINKVWKALEDKNLHVVVQTAPAVRAALGEEFEMPIGTPVTGKMVAGLRKLGFDKVFDTDTAADLTIMEEGFELLDRIKNNGVLPMITSCSPGWIKFCEHYFPDFINNLSSCKSPHVMFGAILKSYYAEKNNIKRENIFVVSVMPCTAKKYEIARDEMNIDNIRDVDAVLTTRELARMFRVARIDFKNLPEENFDDPFGSATGAGVIFGVTGGVMEAALRTVAEKLTGKEILEFKSCRGPEGIKEFSIDLPDFVLRGAVASGMGNARKLLNKIREGKVQYHFIEIMGCPGGCILGGGQPIVDATTRATTDLFNLRANALYSEDINHEIRASHKNPKIIKLYQEYLGEPNSKIAHRLLHTSYKKRKLY